MSRPNLQSVTDENSDSFMLGREVNAGRGGGNGDGTMPPEPPDLVTFRLNQQEAVLTGLSTRSAAIENALTRIEAKLDGLPTKDVIATLPTRDSLRNSSISVAAVIVGTIVAVAALVMSSAGNQLSAFSAGLSAVQAIVALHPAPVEAAPPSRPAVPPTTVPSPARP